MRYLMTQTLVGSWLYAMSSREEVRDEAYRDFLDTLNRVEKERTPAMQNGIDFENEVYTCAKGKPRIVHPQWERGIQIVAQIIKGAAIQVKAQREMVVDGTTYLVYGIMDALRAGTIYDVKFTSTSFGSADLAGKYFDSPQHPAYFYLEPDAREFVYVVSDGTDIYTEHYTPKTSRAFPQIAQEFLAFLDAAKLTDVYREKWETKY